MGGGASPGRVRRIAAYGLCRDEHGRVLLVRASAESAHTGRWFLPGGGLNHGEHPTDALVREVEEETGLTVEVIGLQDVITDLDRLPDGAVRHQDRLIFLVRAAHGQLRDEPDGSTDRAAWFAAAELASLPLMPHVARVLDVAVTEGSGPDVGSPAPVDARAGTGPVPRRFQRFAAYGLVTDAAGRILLTLIAEGYPGAGLWHLPGGGTDFGEPAADALLRELVEETGQHGRITGVLGVSHRRHDRAVGPEGVPIDWHGVRVVFAATVDAPTAPQVIEQAGSTAAAAWFTRREALQRSLTEVAREMITTHTNEPGEHPQ